MTKGKPVLSESAVASGTPPNSIPAILDVSLVTIFTIFPVISSNTFGLVSNAYLSNM
jgi:hypothetical protein